MTSLDHDDVLTQSKYHHVGVMLVSCQGQNISTNSSFILLNFYTTSILINIRIKKARLKLDRLSKF